MKSSSTFNFKVPWALVIAASFVLCCELAVSYLPESVWQSFRRSAGITTAPHLQFRARLETIDRSRPTVVFLGSSQPREGLDPDLIRSSLANSALRGAQFVVLGENDAGPAEIYAELDLVLQYNPALVVISANPKKSFAKYRAFWELGNHTYTLSTAALLLSRFAGSVDSKALSEYATRALLYVMLPSARAVRSYRMIQVAHKVINDRVDGDVEYRYHRTPPPEMIQAQFKNIGRLEYNSQTPVHEGLFDLAIQRLKASKVPVLLIDFPLNPLLAQQVPGGYEAMARSRELQSELAARYHVPYIGFDELPEFSASDFWDVTHLSAEGRAKMSRFIAIQLTKATDRRNGEPL